MGIILSIIQPLLILILIVGIGYAIINRNKNQMDISQQPKTTAKDFFVNLGFSVALYTVVITLLNLLFTVINVAYPPISSYGSYYGGSSSISWPVSILIVFSPILMFLAWILAKDLDANPEKKNLGIHKFLTYLTFFVSIITLVSDLITVIYYYIDGQALTTGFLLKVFVVFVVSLSLFLYHLSNMRGRLTHNSRLIWRILTGLIIIGSIIWGFSVLGSPRTQRLIKYDNQKLNSLQNLNSNVQNYYSSKKVLPQSITELYGDAYYSRVPNDEQTNRPFEYQKISETQYRLCAEFNKDSKEIAKIQGDRYTTPYYNDYSGGITWSHPAGHYCFEGVVTPRVEPKPVY